MGPPNSLSRSLDKSIALFNYRVILEFIIGLSLTNAGSPGQEILVNAVKTNISVAKYEEYKNTLRTNNKDLGIDKALKDYEVDVIVGTPTGRMMTVAALAGYLPLGYARFNGRPFGLAVIAPANAETLALSVMSAWEATFPQRKPPPQLRNWGEESSEK